MVFKEKPTNYYEFIYQEISDDDKIIIGIYPVIYGFRVRAGFVGDLYYYIDYCCGANKQDVELILNAVRNILENREYSKDIFADFPPQYRKPFFNDTENFTDLLKMCSGDIKKVELPELNYLKHIHFEVVKAKYNI